MTREKNIIERTSRKLREIKKKKEREQVPWPKIKVCVYLYRANMKFHVCKHESKSQESLTLGRT